jgi:two-component system chemotaxis response regulator CheY
VRILVVDDDPVSASVLVKGAEVLGHACDVVRDGDAAWRVLSTDHDVDVVVSGWVQPGLSGRDLCLRVRERSVRYLPFVFHTAADDRASQLQGMLAGADDWLRKPLDLHELRLRLVAAERLVLLHRRLEAQANELRRLNGQLERQLRQDVVTGIPNRRRLEEDAQLLYDRAVKLGLGYSLAMIDVDHFKAYNDTYGHARGDEALRAIASRLTRGSRADDQVYRYGGEEFVLVLQTDDPSTACQILERVRRDVERLALPHAASDLGIVTVSIGVATMNPAVPHPATDVIDRADAAMYRAKRQGRNRVVTWDPVEDADTFSRLVERDPEAEAS